MTRTENFKDLVVWQKAHALVIEAYGISKTVLGNSSVDVVSNMCSDTVSIAATIAQYRSNQTASESLRLLSTVQGLAERVRYYCLILGDLGSVDATPFQTRLDEIVVLLASQMGNNRSQGIPDQDSAVSAFPI
ncbi:MAG: four helix bundle protein [Opitutales bacterium]|nr:four helix bundle protein [Opitutales bacterium]